MKKIQFPFTVLFMVLSIVLLMILQGLWLRSEYKGASDAFKRETNLLFRTTVHHLADSLFFSQVNLYSSSGELPEDSLFGLKQEPPRTMGRSITIMIDPAEKNDSLSNGENALSASNMRVMFNRHARPYPPDSLQMHFHRVLLPRFQNLQMLILERDVDWSQHGRFRQMPPGSIDSLPFATAFYPIGMNTVYAANFKGVRWFLLKGMMPQFGFSIFISALILVSFIMIYRSLLSQQRLIEQKNDFIGNMTHELKTPVATVGVALEAMKKFDVLKNPAKAAEYIDMARHELDRLELMTDKILKTSVFDYEKEIRSARGVVDLKEITAKVVASFKLISEKTNTPLSMEFSGNTNIIGHEEHLTQMIYNLVDNGFKYARDPRGIMLSFCEHPDHVLFSITDHGPGIASQHQHRIFDKFYRVPSGNVHTVKGYGLGLHYVAGVVKSHGGKITLVSQEARGARFDVKFPKP